jgi:Tat protein secretion system quality control protein TatD with DNase activity
MSAVLERADRRAALECPLQYAITSFCDLESRGQKFLQAVQRHDNTWLELIQDPRIRLTFGLHPRKCSDYTDDWLASQTDLLKSLLALPGVVGLEVGLDYGHASPSQKAAQQDAVERILVGALPILGSCPILIHLRDAITTQKNPSQVHPDLIRILSKLVGENKLAQDHRIQLHYFRGDQTNKLAQDHRIQLHYFRGDQTTVLKWGELFPNVHFSISGSVEQFSPAE